MVSVRGMALLSTPTVLPIRLIPDGILRVTGAPIVKFDQELRDFVEAMKETMYKAPGIGLAAPQVGESRRVFVMDTSDDKSGFAAFINPEIVRKSGKEQSEEGCLSIPGFRETIQRSKNIVVRAQSVDGELFECEAEDLDAFCIQHELDHLNGILFTDHLSRLKKPIFKDWLREEGILEP